MNVYAIESNSIIESTSVHSNTHEMYLLIKTLLPCYQAQV